MKTSILNWYLVILLILGCTSSAAEESTCYGTAANGRLEGGVKLPSEGPNFESYSFVGTTLGRTYLHSRVQKIVVDAYKRLEADAPGKIFKYGETGHAEGGEFWPHKTHQNGLSVDFMVPVIDENGESVQLPTNVFNKWGYGIEFDKRGRYKNYTLDYDAMAAHLVTLHQAAQKAGVKIRRVIFDPRLQKALFKTERGKYLRQNITFSKKRSWVRHDNHYHIDFRLRCK